MDADRSSAHPKLTSGHLCIPAGGPAQRLPSLTGLRFYAAMLVVVSHLSKNFWGTTGAQIFSVGSVGVSFFFVLSGFVLTWSRQPLQRKSDFYRNRFARVYPLHFLGLTSAAVLIAVGHDSLTWPVAIACVLLVQAWVPFEHFYFGLNGPSWSLSCEAFFYALFPFLAPRILERRTQTLVRFMVYFYATVAVLTLVAHLLLRDGPVIGVLYVNPGYRVWEFVLGIALGALLRRGVHVPFSFLVAVSTTGVLFVLMSALNLAIMKNWSVFAMLPMQALPTDLASMVLLPCFMAIIATVVNAELHGGGVGAHLSNPLIVRLGEWSFALYLSHLLIISTVRHFLPGLSTGYVGVLLSFPVVAACIGVSALLYTFFERPLEARIRGNRR
ncbi:acyltransferase [Rhodococcus ruber]|uniref:Acyltransferase n=1 Tax=Rhodococcus ruber TaxID=1830 RepID=A0ABT4MAP9_9NOCA|nr:acyltransferase [Rhodococcus ruber]MCZ4518047.1 acyltransferase [Rhodococcus ruber]